MSQPCLPPPFSVSATTATAGATVTVAASDATCNPRYGKTAQVQVTLRDSNGVEIVKELAPMNDQGGFSVELHIPAAAAPGPAAVEAYPYNLDWCDDTGRNNRVGRSATAPAIERVSCAPSVQKFLIEP
ncbi:hypothetical protein CVV68_01670 [Arthrobacter livingstonensis]|uniref:Uncharacterized protein n=1 Tax=Arthrobacter livingstonensis TaxID=670078 RepID=A0A2V5LDY0_9MICC|nr:hypothetical protein [Arthrobacter livingstonensis]PYI69839.1 hypothetical protein CVV68_01670 [Arthrobacter livingstonensis]